MKEKITRRMPLESSFVPREAWGPGPWDDEPDRVEWKTAAGLPALVMRSPLSGSFCGYVAVPPGHPSHGKDYDDVDVSVHGGLTYAAGCSADICHEPEPGEPDNVWWLGFDTGHAFDYMPAMEARVRKTMPPDLHSPGPFVGSEEEEEWRSVYRDLGYVRTNCEALAMQLLEMGS